MTRMMDLWPQQREYLFDALETLRARLSSLNGDLKRGVGHNHDHPQIEEMLKRVSFITNRLTKLQRNVLAENPVDLQLDDDKASVVRLALSIYIHDHTKKLESIETRTDDYRIRKPQQELVGDLQRIYTHREIRDVIPADLPSLAEFVNLKTYYLLRKPDRSLDEFDEKFGIHRSPSLFLADVEALREECRFRRAALCVAFVDIDDFKTFNTDLTHEAVDAYVLPRFMHALESNVYGRGHVYRQGGDEYLVLVPNMDFDDACRFFNAMREKVARLEFSVLGKKAPELSVSVGFVIVPPGSWITPRKIRELANDAAMAAKGAGKNSVYGREGDSPVRHAQVEEV